MLKNRKQLPCFGYLDNMHIDMNALLAHMKDNNLLDFTAYADIKVSANSKMKEFVIANEYCHTTFFKEKDAPMMDSDLFRHITLTDFDESKSKGEVKFKFTNIFERTKRLNPLSKNYLPEADEMNYGKRNKFVTGELEKILDMFTSKITRARLAFLSGTHEIKPHVDYDPTYVTRYHIPIITDTGVMMYMKNKDKIYQQHFPADGKVYFFNAGLKHWVKNESSSARLHLIIDVHGQEELEHLVPLGDLVKNDSDIARELFAREKANRIQPSGGEQQLANELIAG